MIYSYSCERVTIGDSFTYIETDNGTNVDSVDSLL